jgi:hypothetical protein
MSGLALLPTEVTIVFEDETYIVAGCVLTGIGSIDVGHDLVRGVVTF